jgi:hypothetical protein
MPWNIGGWTLSIALFDKPPNPTSAPNIYKEGAAFLSKFLCSSFYELYDLEFVGVSNFFFPNVEYGHTI